jgi:4-amino-4-deoxy-L-arabinose transferase-like glycosyltransferase
MGHQLPIPIFARITMSLPGSHKAYLPIIMIVGCILLFSALGKMPLYILDEVRNAQCAKEMMQRDDWIVPTFNGELRVAKPPAHYYFMRTGYAIFGVNELGARFFSAVMGLLTLLVTYLFVKRYSSAKHAFITCLVLLSSLQILFEFRMSVPDPYLIFFTTLTLFAGFAYFKEMKLYWLLICAAAMGLGVLAKGPVSIALPGASVLVWLIWERKWRDILSWKILLAALVLIAVAAPWYFAVDKATDGEWTKGFFIDNNLNRFSDTMEGHGGIFLLVPLFVLVGLLPATIFIGESFKGFKQQFSSSLMKFSVCVMATFLVFFSISSTKLPNYPMPCYAFIAIILAKWITDAIEGRKKTPLYPFIILLIINLALPFAAYFGIKNEIELKGFENLSFVMILLPLGVVLSIFIFRRYGFAQSLSALAILYAIFHLVFFSYLYPRIYLNNPMSKTIQKVKDYDHVVSYGLFNSAYVFYVDGSIKEFHDPGSLQNFLREHPNTIIITRKEKANELQPLSLHKVAEHHDLFELPTTVLLTNKK